MAQPTLADLMARFPRPGRLQWIGLRPARRTQPQTPGAAVIDAGGLAGDRYAGRSGKRAVTLIQAEHLPVIAALCEFETIAPALLRRNLVVSGVNLLALRDRRLQVGEAVLEGTGPCDPCSRMEEALGEGGYNAMRGHGGITARVVAPGRIRLGDPVLALAADPGAPSASH